MTQSSGLFITFEGGEGAGKGTQIKKLCQMLDKLGIDYIKTREPGGCIEAETLRDLLVRESQNNWTAFSELLLMSTARHEHLQKLIRPALLEGKWVICDRFMDSTTVYQGYAHGINLTSIHNMHQQVVGDTMPNLTFVLDIDPKVGIPRSKGNIHMDGKLNQETRFENLNIEFHEKVRRGYLEIAENNHERCVVINAETSIDDVFLQISNALALRLNL